MHKVLGPSVLVLLSVAIPAAGQKVRFDVRAPAAAGATLPVSRVILYKNGIGYFENSARIDGSDDLHIDFTTEQLNDVLATLTAADLGNGKVTSVRFNSIAPLSERLRALHLPLGENTTRQQFLDALRGTRVEIRSGSTNATGKVLSVENVTKTFGPDRQSENVLVLSIVTDGGDFRSFELGPGVSVRIANHELEGDVSQYLDLIGSARAADVRRMSIADEGSGERTVLVSYISEVPVWKSTYRVLLDAGDKPTLQGWAIVDNTTGEDWKDVQLSLESGAPQSFVENLAVPYYVQRPVVPLPHSILLTPQTHEEALMQTLKSTPEGVAGGVPGGVPGGQVGGVLGGMIGGNYGASGRAFNAAPQAQPAMAMDAIRREQSQATGRAVGELFEYDIKNRVTIGRNQSAMVPILQAPFEAEKVTLWNASDPVPLRALDLTNSTGLTLDGGTFDVVDGGVFEGEGIFDTIRAGDKRLISYAADPALQVTTKEGSSTEPVTRIVIAKGLMTTTRELRSRETYRISNSDSKPRTVLIESPVRPGWKLAGEVKPAETTADLYRFKVNVSPQAGARLVIAQTHPESSEIELTNLTGDEVALLAQQKALPPEMEAAFRKILAQKKALQALEDEIQSRQQEVQNISSDQNRIRENMKALKGGAEEKQLLDRYVRELNLQEDRLNALNAQIAGLKTRRDAASAQLDAAIEGLSANETL